MIPIYRAKRLDNGKYVEGYFFKHKSEVVSWMLLEENYVTDEYEIDPSTLAIHFSDMLDKNGKPIFASLSEDGIGGDKFHAEQFYNNYKIGERDMIAKMPWFQWGDSTWENLEVTGIYEGEGNHNEN